MSRQFAYTFDRVNDVCPTTCLVCDQVDDRWYLAVRFADALAGAVCSECATDVQAALRAATSTKSAPSTTVATVTFGCEQCGRSFGRVNHLARHRATHKAA